MMLFARNKLEVEKKMGNCQMVSLTIIIFITISHFHYSHQLSDISSSSSSISIDEHDLNKTLLCHPDQSLALLQFKSSFVIGSVDLICNFSGAPAYPKTETWKEGTDCCSSWHGVTCHAVTGHVIGLDLSCSGLLGTIHSNSSLFSLSNLQRLNLAYNYFQESNIYAQFGVKFADTLTHLNLSSSNFNGYVPSEISHLSKLVSLDLSWNFDLAVESDSVLKSIAQNLTRLRILKLSEIDMSLVVDPFASSSLMNLSSSLTYLSLYHCGLKGKFPDSFLLLFPNLQELNLADNFELSGSLPKSWSNWTNLSKLRVLDLSGTNLSGELPAGLFASLKALVDLDLSICNLSGPIPASLGNLTKITNLGLLGNHFSGEVPSSIGNLKQLVYFAMDYNRLSGQIPDILNLTQLEYISLSENQLEGPLLSSPSHSHSQPHPALFPYLRYLDLSSNFLNGTIPSWLFALPSLTHIVLHNNSFTGLPDEFSCQSLQNVYLSNNKIHGPVPRSIFRCENLTRLDLHQNFLTGHLNDKFVCQSLEYMALSNNMLHGPIPRSIFECESLTSLYLHQNLLTGSIAHYSLNNIEYIDLHSNFLEGPLPVIPLNTTYFSVANNSFTGEISSLICDAKSLDILDLSFNKLFGLIPQCLGTIQYLSVLNLRMNNFRGYIPDTFVKDNLLNYLNLNGNKLEGALPRSLTNCEYLQVLDLGNNLIEDVFPAWLGKLPKLQVLVLRSNKFQGFIDIGVKINDSFPMLRILDLSTNNFKGPLPARLIKNLKSMINISAEEGDEPHYVGIGYGSSYEFSVMVTMKGVTTELVKILTIFTTIDVSNNKFQGKIPKEIGELCSLKGLNLSNNCLIGYIPSSIGKLVNLEWLDLSSNKLVGQIPPMLVDLNSLAVLNLSHNHLHGPIPQGKQFNTFNEDSYMGNSGLCGFPLPKSCGSDKSTPPTQPASLDKDSRIEFNWKASYVGYGCGTIFGIGMGYLMFSTGWPKWFVKMVEGKRHRKVQRFKRIVKRRGPTRN